MAVARYGGLPLFAAYERAVLEEFALILHIEVLLVAARIEDAAPEQCAIFESDGHVGLAMHRTRLRMQVIRLIDHELAGVLTTPRIVIGTAAAPFDRRLLQNRVATHRPAQTGHIRTHMQLRRLPFGRVGFGG